MFVSDIGLCKRMNSKNQSFIYSLNFFIKILYIKFFRGKQNAFSSRKKQLFCMIDDWNFFSIVKFNFSKWVRKFNHLTCFLRLVKFCKKRWCQKTFFESADKVNVIYFVVFNFKNEIKSIFFALHVLNCFNTCPIVSFFSAVWYFDQNCS